MNLLPVHRSDGRRDLACALVGSVALEGSVDVDPTVAVAIGNQPAGAGDRPFLGMIDDVRILQRPMSADELVALANG